MSHACDSPLDLVYRDASIIVVNKPVGLLSVPGRGADKQDCLTARIRKEFTDALSVHRLDMATSGLMVFARGAGMQRRLSQMFREREVEKRYVAVVMGKVEPSTGVVDLPVVADWPNRPRRKIDIGSGKPSLTRFRVLGYETTARRSIHQGERNLVTTRVELEPVTGRTHQLRVHMAAIGHPVLGDTLYGGDAGSNAERLLLHAGVLGFAHPLSEVPLAWVSEPQF